MNNLDHASEEIPDRPPMSDAEMKFAQSIVNFAGSVGCPMFLFMTKNIKELQAKLNPGLAAWGLTVNDTGNVCVATNEEYIAFILAWYDRTE